jgi:GT2 family glycosyltransferase
VISIVVLTHNRAHLLRRCVEDVLARTSSATKEIVIWNNGSSDETEEYLESLSDPRITVVQHPRNIGQNAYALAFAQTSGDYLVELDDDIIGAPEAWDLTLLEALRRLPNVGFLAADLEDNEHDETANVRYRVRPHLYNEFEVNGVRLLTGPAGGGCAMTPRTVYDKVGGFRQHKTLAFWSEEAAYIEDISKLGYEKAVLADLKVLHAGGPYYSKPSPEKELFWARYRRAVRRKNTVKRFLLGIPFVRPLNERHEWFQPPERPQLYDFDWSSRVD